MKEIKLRNSLKNLFKANNPSNIYKKLLEEIPELKSEKLIFHWINITGTQSYLYITNKNLIITDRNKIFIYPISTLNLNLLEYGFWKSILKGGKYWIQLSDENDPKLESKKVFGVGLIVYTNGVRSVRNDKKATKAFYQYLQNCLNFIKNQGVPERTYSIITLNENSRLNWFEFNDADIYNIITLNENKKGQLDKKDYSSVSIQESLIIINNTLHIINEDYKSIKFSEIRNLQKVEVKKLIGKITYIEIEHDKGIERLGIYFHGNIEKKMTEELFKTLEKLQT